MNSSQSDFRNAQFEPRLREVQENWSNRDRQERAETGRRRVPEFVQLMESAEDDFELWAVGAPSWDDLRRLQE